VKTERMTCSRARVLKCEGDWAKVEVTRSAMCDGCSEAASCISSLESGKKASAVVKNPLGAKAGDQVELSINQGVILRGTAILYLIPVALLLAFIAGALFMNSFFGWGKSENAVAALAGALGLALSFPVVRVISKRWKYLADQGPEISRILPPEAD
jgi:sigma-E factor negative regulatory protein RseC